jgi:uncharacterized protein (DUF1778 family)
MSLDARLDFRLSSQLKELIVEAACISGQSVSDFAVSTLAETARRIVQQNSVTTLSNRDRDIFLALLDADAQPNAALKQAAERFKRR